MKKCYSNKFLVLTTCDLTAHDLVPGTLLPTQACNPEAPIAPPQILIPISLTSSNRT